MNSAERRLPVSAGRLTKLATGWLTMFVVGSDLFVVSPLLPLIAADYGIRPALAGLSVTLFSVSYMLSAPLLGFIADRIGRARVLTYCLIAFGAANLLTAICGSFSALLAARLVAGATAAGVSPSVYALVGGAAPSDQRATWLAVVVSGLLLSLSFGTPIGLLAGASHGWHMVFAGLGILSLVLACVNTCVWRAEHGVKLLATPPLAVTAAVARLAPTVLWSSALYAMYTYLGGGLTSFGYSAGEIAEVILFYGWGAIAGILIGGRMTDRLGAKSTRAIGLAGLGLCFLLLRLALDAGVLVDLAFGLSSAAAQLFFPAQQVNLANEFPARRATILAWNNSALFFGISLGSMIGGEAIAIAGFDADLIISAAIATVGWIIARTESSRSGVGQTISGAVGDPAASPIAGTDQDTRGRVIVTVVPDPSSLSMPSVPPCSSTTDFANGNPRPAP
jgi:predicted MFS family arabinose efflux permease